MILISLCLSLSIYIYIYTLTFNLPGKSWCEIHSRCESHRVSVNEAPAASWDLLVSQMMNHIIIIIIIIIIIDILIIIVIIIIISIIIMISLSLYLSLSLSIYIYTYMYTYTYIYIYICFASNKMTHMPRVPRSCAGGEPQSVRPTLMQNPRGQKVGAGATD